MFEFEITDCEVLKRSSLNLVAGEIFETYASVATLRFLDGEELFFSLRDGSWHFDFVGKKKNRKRA